MSWKNKIKIDKDQISDVSVLLSYTLYYLFVPLAEFAKEQETGMQNVGKFLAYCLEKRQVFVQKVYKWLPWGRIFKKIQS